MNTNGGRKVYIILNNIDWTSHIDILVPRYISSFFWGLSLN